MKKYNLFLTIVFFHFHLISCSNNTSGSKDELISPPTASKAAELTTPSILSPQQGAVCQGTKQNNGKYSIIAKSTEHYGADTYLFQVWNGKGELIDEFAAKTNQAKLTNMEQGHAYTLAVTVSNISAKQQSNKVSFCTPGIQTINYIPTVKSATYSQKTNTLSITLYDPDTTDKMLCYTVISSNTKDFKDQKIIINNKSISKQIPITLYNIILDNGTYIKVIVKDRTGSQSAYSFQIQF